MPKLIKLSASVCIALGFMACASTAFASDAVDATYRADRAICMSGQSNQDRATCLKEAGAARSVGRRHQLDDRQGSYRQNALARCSALPADDRNDCQRRIDGDGKVSGSVRGGGLIREVTTVVPATPADPSK